MSVPASTSSSSPTSAMSGQVQGLRLRFSVAASASVCSAVATMVGAGRSRVAADVSAPAVRSWVTSSPPAAPPMAGTAAMAADRSPRRSAAAARETAAAEAGRSSGFLVIIAMTRR
jgi:hypothetical protein